MSTGWKQSQQEGSAHAPYEEAWPHERDNDVPWQDPSQDAVGQRGAEPWAPPGRRGAEPWAAGYGGAGYEAGYPEPWAAAPEGAGNSEPWIAGHSDAGYSQRAPGGHDHHPEPWEAGYGETGYPEPWVAGPGDAGYYPEPGSAGSGYYPEPGSAESGYYPEPSAGSGEAGYYSEPWVVAQDPSEPWPPGQRADAGYLAPRAPGWDHARSQPARQVDTEYPESLPAGQDRAEPWSAAVSDSQSWASSQDQEPQPSEQPQPQRAAPAQTWDKPAQSYQQEWDQAGSSSDDEADYDWYRYLGQGLSPQAKPAAMARPQPPAAGNGTTRSTRSEPETARRRGFSRSGREKSRTTAADPGSCDQESNDPDPGQPEQRRAEVGRADFTEPGLGRAEQRRAEVGRADFTEPGRGKPEPWRPETGQGNHRQPAQLSGVGSADVGPALAGHPQNTDESPSVGDTARARGRHGTPAGTRRSAAPVPGRRLRGRQSSPSGAAAVQAPVKREPDRQEPVRRQPDRREPVKRQPDSPAPATLVPAAAPANRKVPEEPAVQPARSASRADRPRRPRRRLTGRRIGLLVGGVVVLAGGAATAVFLHGSGGGVPHVLVTPANLGNYVQAPLLAQNMGAAELQKQIVANSGGEAKHVVYAVYEDATGPAAQHGPQIILFIGGNLSGTSSGSFMSSFMGKLQGASTTSAGSMGGAAACVPSVGGRLAECAWADSDTFGVVASPTLGAAALASELRAVRPLVEKRAT